MIIKIGKKANLVKIKNKQGKIFITTTPRLIYTTIKQSMGEIRRPRDSIQQFQNQIKSIIITEAIKNTLSYLFS